MSRCHSVQCHSVTVSGNTRAIVTVTVSVSRCYGVRCHSVTVSGNILPSVVGTLASIKAPWPKGTWGMWYENTVYRELKFSCSTAYHDLLDVRRFFWSALRVWGIFLCFIETCLQRRRSRIV